MERGGEGVATRFIVFGFKCKDSRKGNLKYSEEILQSKGKYYVIFLCYVLNFKLTSHLA
jgi:hypothetical protein